MAHRNQQDAAEQQLRRVRAMCLALPDATERLSHGEPTFFVRNRVFVMFASDHHGDGRVAVWLPAAMGVQELLTEGDPQTYFKPPYVGARGWLGIELDRLDDEQLQSFVHDAWTLVAPKRLREARVNNRGGD